MVHGRPLLFLAGKSVKFIGLPIPNWPLTITGILSLYRVVFTRKVSNTIKDRQPKLGKYFKPWNNITNGTLNPTDSFTVSPKSTKDEKYDEFFMNGEFSLSYPRIQTKLHFQNFLKIMVAMQMIAIARPNSLKNSMKSQLATL